MKSNGSSVKSIALLIDAENAPAAKIHAVIEKLSGYGVINIRRAYGNWKKPNLASWEDKLREHAIQPVQHFDMVKGKNASDMALLIDAMDILYTKNVGTFGLVSSDCDFTPLILRLRGDGKQVIVFGNGQASLSLVKSCTEFVELEGNKRVVIAKKEKVTTVAPVVKKKEDAAVRRARELRANTKLINLLRKAVGSAVKDPDGWSTLPHIGAEIRKDDSSFKPKTYGFAKFRSLFDTLGVFEVREPKNGTQLMVRERGSGKAGLG